MNRRLIAIFSVLVLSGCGSVRELKPAVGHSLPPAPYGRADQPTAAELLQTSPQAIPVRQEELRRQSEERADDPFDLPPDTKPAAKP